MPGTTRARRGLARWPLTQKPLSTSTTMIDFMVFRVLGEVALRAVAPWPRRALLLDRLQARVGSERAPRLGAGLAVHFHHIGGEVGVAA